MKDKLLVIGASGHGKVVADIALKMRKWETIEFLDDDESIKTSLGFKVVGKSSGAFSYIQDYDVFVGIGNNETREKIQQKLENAGASISTLIHPMQLLEKKLR